MRITKTQLLALNACKEQVTLFENTFPKGLLLTGSDRQVKKIVDSKLDYRWFASCVLDHVARKTYDETCDVAWKTYVATCAASAVTYDETCAAAWKTYAAAQKTYDATCAVAWETYHATCVKTLINILRWLPTQSGWGQS